MSSDALSSLTKKTENSGQELTMLVRQLAESAAPLEGKFNGSARAAFDQFKLRTDDIARELDGALSAVLSGVAGMDRAFAEGDAEGSDEIRGAQGSASFDAARFGGAR
ncbi:hypothetical protein HGK34_00915 [Myceligenerans sp. I2]|uniref:WXG100 family type VII secretion target n=2 Tax=Myceligenerans indicum TaxID=2593663 RepID=A0ABS1LF82_9MICO|nr:hypothetical protein [Myceligenerans indicum]